MPHYLLTGAGFSRNWGGWLANEAFEYLLGAPEIDDYLRNVLWGAKLRGEGFEGALSVVQGAYASNKSAETKQRLDSLTQAVVGMFKMVGFKCSIFTSASLDCFVRSLTPHILWQYAEEETQIALAIRLAAIEIRRVSGCPSPEYNCHRFSIGPSFLQSLQAWEGSGQSKYAGSTLDTCARIVARMPKDEPARLFKPSRRKGKTENVVRPSDNAQAWRTHISKDHEAMRLMFWRKPDGSIELANVGAKAELEIL